MKFSLNIGKRFGGLTAEEKRILERLKRREITLEQAERELGGHLVLHEEQVTFDGGSAADGPMDDDSPAPIEETSEERAARELVERIAREVDAESAR